MWQKYEYQKDVLNRQDNKATVKFNKTGAAYLNEAAIESFNINGETRVDIMIDPGTRRMAFVPNKNGTHKLSSHGPKVRSVACSGALRVIGASPKPNKPYPVIRRYRKTYVKIAEKGE